MKKFIIAAFAMIACSSAAQAQTRMGIFAGVGEYDLSGVDQGTVIAFRYANTLRRYAVLEIGVAHTELRMDDVGVTNLYLPDAHLHLQLPLGRFAPYLGGGVGLGFNVPKGIAFDTEVDVTFSAATGVRVDLPFQMTIGLDGRIRTFGTGFTASGSEGVLGISYRF